MSSYISDETITREADSKRLAEKGLMFDRNYCRSFAVFSTCDKYRYALVRQWIDVDEPNLLVYIGLNPSTADHEVSDPTVTRCEIRARRAGYHGFVMLNMFGFRATDPSVMRSEAFPNSPEGSTANDESISHWCQGRDVVAAWGASGGKAAELRQNRILELLSSAKRVVCLGTTKSGMPRHPLYVALKKKFVDFLERAVA